MPTIARRPVASSAPNTTCSWRWRAPGCGSEHRRTSLAPDDAARARPGRPQDAESAVRAARPGSAARVRTPPTCGSTSRSPRSPSPSGRRGPTTPRPVAPRGDQGRPARRRAAPRAGRRPERAAAAGAGRGGARGLRARGRLGGARLPGADPAAVLGGARASSATACRTRCCTPSSRRWRWSGPRPTTRAGAASEAGSPAADPDRDLVACRCRGSSRSPRPTGWWTSPGATRPWSTAPGCRRPGAGWPGRCGRSRTADLAEATDAGADAAADVVAEVGELGRWLEEFHSRSWLELDYAGLARLLGRRGARGRLGRRGGRRGGRAHRRRPGRGGPALRRGRRPVVRGAGAGAGQLADLGGAD